MIEKTQIKKELTQIEFDKILLEFQESIIEQKNRYLDKLIQKFVQEITPAKEIHILLVSKKKDILETITLKKNIMIDISSGKGLLSKCYLNHEAYFSNDINRDTDYCKEVDNFLPYPLKNLLVVPLFDTNNNLLGIIWAAIPKKDLNQYMQSDINYMMQMPLIDKKILEQRNSKIMESENIGKEFSKENISMVKKLKSWLFK